MQALVDAEASFHAAAIALEAGAALSLTGRQGFPRLLDELEVSVLRDRYLGCPPGLARVRRGLTWWKYARFVRRLVGEVRRVRWT